MGKCILAGHPPAGDMLKIARGRTSSSTVSLTAWGFTSTPTICCTSVNTTGYRTPPVSIGKVSKDSFEWSDAGGFNSGFTDTFDVNWIAIGT